MATVLKRGKRWYAIYQGDDGRQRWKAGYHDKNETLKLARRLEDDAGKIRNGDIDPATEIKRAERAKAIDQHISGYESRLKAAGRSANHVDYTIQDIREIAEASGATNARHITVETVDRWKLGQMEAQAQGVKGTSNKTINRKIGSVQQFLKHLKSSGAIDEYVLFKYPKLPTGGKHARRVSRDFTRDELGKLLADAEKPDRHALYNFAARTGLRMNECRQVTPAFFNFEHRTIHVPKDVAKAKKDQVIPLHPELVELVKGLCKDKASDERILHVPDKKCVNRNLRADCKRLGISIKNVSFHSLRHTFCTLLARANVHPAILQKLARHSDLKTTLGYYVHLQRVDELDAIAKL